MSGTCYGVSVGPGDPELMTLKAVRTLNDCAVIAAPQTRNGDMLALDIARGSVDVEGKDILALTFTMSKDPAVREASYAENTAKIEAALDAGNDVAFVCLGDISVFSTFCYVMERLVEDGYACEMIPGVTSFSAIAARLGQGLTEMNQPLHIIPASRADLDEALAYPGTKVLMKSASHLPETVAAIQKAGLGSRSSLVSDCGLNSEYVCKNLDDYREVESYFTTIIVR